MYRALLLILNIYVMYTFVLLILNGKKTVKFITLRRKATVCVKQSKVKYLLAISHSLSSLCGEIKDLLKT